MNRFQHHFVTLTKIEDKIHHHKLFKDNLVLLCNTQLHNELQFQAICNTRKTQHPSKISTAMLDIRLNLDRIVNSSKTIPWAKHKKARSWKHCLNSE